MELRPITESWLNTTIVALKHKYESDGHKASGKYGRSLNTEGTTFRKNSFTALINGAKHAKYKTDGTEPQKSPSPEKAKKIYPIILQWIKDKGLGFDKGRAFAIALKIVYKGIEVPNRYNAGDMISGVLTEQRIDQLMNQISDEFKTSVKSEILEAWR